MDYAKVYSEMHKNEKWFAGTTLKRYADDVAKLVATQKPRNILDYGSGKGFQYLKLRLHERWGGMLPYCYDVGVRQLAERPDMKFDGVICTDMMEHIEEQDVPKILDDIFGFLTDDDRPTFALISVACRPADHKKLPDNRNVHVTVKPPEWWQPKIDAARKKRNLKQLLMSVCYEHEDGKVVRGVAS